MCSQARRRVARLKNESIYSFDPVGGECRDSSPQLAISGLGKCTVLQNISPAQGIFRCEESDDCIQCGHVRKPGSCVRVGREEQMCFIGLPVK